MQATPMTEHDEAPSGGSRPRERITKPISRADTPAQAAGSRESSSSAGAQVAARGLPIGTITFLFTDVEGSTRLWERLPDAANRALMRHDALIEARLHGAPVSDRIRTAEVTAATSRAAQHPELRARLVELQRAFVAEHGGVMEGRDIGTVVVPDTPFKFFLEASAAKRAERRQRQLAAAGVECDLDEIARQIAERDERDSTRSASPLAAAPDAVRVSSDELDADAVVTRLRSEIERRR